MSVVILKFAKRWTRLGGLMLLATVGGCAGSEFSNRLASLEVAGLAVAGSSQCTGVAERPHTAVVRWQVLNQGLMQSVCDQESLNELRLISSTRDGSSILTHVSQLPYLETLSIIEVPLADRELEVLSEVTHLTSLELSRTGITGEGLRHLAKLPLKQLVIREKHLSIEGLQAIASMTELEELELVVPNLHLADLPILASFEKLTSVTITDGYFSYRKYGGLKWLVGAPNLKQLELSGVNLNDRSLESIGTLASLQNLMIDKCVISEAGVGHLAKLERLRFVDIPALNSLSNEKILRLAERDEEEVVLLPIRS